MLNPKPPDFQLGVDLSEMPSKIKSYIRKNMPGTHGRYIKLKELARRLRYGKDHMETVFTYIYSNHGWGYKKTSESHSGGGSNLAETVVLRKELPLLLQRIGAKTMLDAPCGDFHWMQHTDLRLQKYIGGDIVRDLIEQNQKLHGNANTEFRVMDITMDPIPRVDIILCRDCFIHFSFKYIFSAIHNFKRSQSTYLLTNIPKGLDKNVDILTGQFRRLDLRLPPFNFPEPLQMIVDERYDADGNLVRCRNMGLFKFADIV